MDVLKRLMKMRESMIFTIVLGIFIIMTFASPYFFDNCQSTSTTSWIVH